MRRILPLAVLLVACGGSDDEAANQTTTEAAGAGSHEELADRTVAAAGELVTILGSVKDKASAEKAKADLDALSKRLNAIRTDIGAIGLPSAEEQKELAERMKGGLGGMSDRLHTVMSDLSDKPDLSVPLQAPAAKIMGLLADIRKKLGG